MQLTLWCPIWLTNVHGKLLDVRNLTPASLDRLLSIDNILHSWDVSIFGGPLKKKRMERWSHLPNEVLKFIFDGAARAKPRVVGIGGVL